MNRSPNSRQLAWLIVFWVVIASPGVFASQPIRVSPDDAVIVLRDDPASEDQLAATELQHHLQLITGREIPVIQTAPASDVYPFYIATPAPGDEEPFACEEARYVVSQEGAWFYGDRSRRNIGARFAVYAFLEGQLGVRWLEPGDEGIAFTSQDTLVLEPQTYQWIPELVFRKIRQSIRHDQLHRPIGRPSTDAFLISKEEHNREVEEEILWQDRMRMGGSRPGGAHAFRDWWEKYGQTHPDYFALNKFGERKPVPLPKGRQRTIEFIKICPSNPQVANQLIEEWKPRSDVQQYVSTGPNDGYNFCRCEACMALDVRYEGEAFPGHLTDRYVFLANEVARQAREHRPDAWAAMYAYLTTLQPPRKRRLEPNIVVHIVPYVIPLDTETNAQLFKGWQQAGATRLALRPNYHHKYMVGSLPLGIEKQMFDVFQQAVRYGTISADYDSLMGNWPVTGFADYVLAKAMSDPSKSFEYWEDHYMQGFGAAASDIKRYYAYWRQNVWDERLAPALEPINDAGRYGFFIRGLMWTLGDHDYYRLADFDRTDAILRKAASRNLTSQQRQRVEQLQLANQHARLVYLAATADGQERYHRTRELVEFRKEHKDVLRMSWVRLIGLEDRYNWTEVNLVEQLKEYPLPWVQTGMAWQFKMDPQDIGLAEGWQNIDVGQAKDWQQLRTDNFWENPYRSETDPALRESLSEYDGVGWYVSRLNIPKSMRGRNLYLRFGGVGDTCDVYVNGVHVGSHTVASEEAKQQPFTIPINAGVDWNRSFQDLCIRVDNQHGKGGLFNRIWLVSKSDVASNKHLKHKAN